MCLLSGSTHQLIYLSRLLPTHHRWILSRHNRGPFQSCRTFLSLVLSPPVTFVRKLIDHRAIYHRLRLGIVRDLRQEVAPTTYRSPLKGIGEMISGVVFVEEIVLGDPRPQVVSGENDHWRSDVISHDVLARDHRRISAADRRTHRLSRDDAARHDRPWSIDYPHDDLALCHSDASAGYRARCVRSGGTTRRPCRQDLEDLALGGHDHEYVSRSWALFYQTYAEMTAIHASQSRVLRYHVSYQTAEGQD